MEVVVEAVIADEAAEVTTVVDLEAVVVEATVVVGAVVKFGAFFLKFFGIFLAVGGYALIWGWSFAAGVVLLILVLCRRRRLRPLRPFPLLPDSRSYSRDLRVLPQIREHADFLGVLPIALPYFQIPSVLLLHPEVHTEVLPTPLVGTALTKIDYKETDG